MGFDSEEVVEIDDSRAAAGAGNLPRVRAVRGAKKSQQLRNGPKTGRASSLNNFSPP